ncbi:MAG: Fur family transcriptional regulator [Planctomycetota bacterium]|jgi:Fe2+ or Zn2+ uptake regulation protein
MSSIRELFAGRHLRCTAQRRALYEALLRDNNHPTAEELYRRVKLQMSRLSLATVYNTLEALCKVGLVRKLPTNNGRCRYDADPSEHLHVCFRDDGVIEDVPNELGDRLIQQLPRSAIAQIERELGVEVDGLSVQLLVRRVGGDRAV